MGERAGVQQIVVVSIIGADRFTTGYIASKVPHERAMQSGPIPVRILRAAQFHEFVPLFLEWGRQGDVIYVPQMRTQPVAAREVLTWATRGSATRPPRRSGPRWSTPARAPSSRSWPRAMAWSWWWPAWRARCRAWSRD